MSDENLETNIYHKTHALIHKYDVPVPRYTSYPTVPYWQNTPLESEWLEHLKATIAKPDASASLYVHIPFCESLCTFCGCNTAITKDHGKGSPYVQTVLAELDIYLKNAPELKNFPFKHLHLGGGTPTFLSPESLKGLYHSLAERLNFTEMDTASIEVDPRRTTLEHFKALRDVGFNRVSLGVQDFNFSVQRLINRVQSFEQTESNVTWARDLGYKSVNFDLIYGLPQQTPESFQKTIEATIQLRPDRIALYSFALVPWIRPAQRLFKDSDLPVGQEKRALYDMARDAFLKQGYIEIGMDHFALPTDDLAIALENKNLHRNFMGYTEVSTDLLLGLGVSAISETPTCFYQNEKVLPVYEKKIMKGELTGFRGHFLTKEDQKRRSQILKLMSLFEVDLEMDQEKVVEARLSEMIKDGLVEIADHTLKLKPEGRAFLRNACTSFDERLYGSQPNTRIFSQSI